MIHLLRLPFPQIADLTSKLRDKEHQLQSTSESAKKLNIEREEEREQLLNRIELLKSELLQFQEKQDEVGTTFSLNSLLDDSLFVVFIVC